MNINLEGNCNQDCVFCQRNSLRDPSKTPTTKQVKEQIASGTVKERINFAGGGEPTMRDDLPELIAYAMQQGFGSISIETNAVRLSDLSYLRTLKAAGLTSCQVSLHSHLESVSDALNRAPGTFKKNIMGIENAISEGLAIDTLLFTITSDNHSGMIEYLDFIRSSFPHIKQVIIGFIKPIPGDALSASHTPKLSEIELELYLALEHGRSLGLGMTLSLGCDVPFCYLPKNEDCSLSLWTLVESGKQESGRESHTELRIKLECCRLCRLTGICPGIFKSYISAHGEAEFYPLFIDPKEILRQVSGRLAQRSP